MAADKKMVGDDDVYAVTRQGEAELKGAKTRVPTSALELLVRIDGRSSVAAIRAGITGASSSKDVADTFEWLLQSGLIEIAKKTDDGTIDFTVAAPLAPSAAAVTTATREGGAGVPSLQQRGYSGRIARRPAARPHLPTDRKPVVVVVEDEPQLAKFLKHFLVLEGFDVRTAG